MKATYLLCGYLHQSLKEEEQQLSQKSNLSILSSSPSTVSTESAEVVRQAIRLVPEEHLSEARALFSAITAESIYALHPNVLRDAVPLAQLQDETESMVYTL